MHDRIIPHFQFRQVGQTDVLDNPAEVDLSHAGTLVLVNLFDFSRHCQAHASSRWVQVFERIG